MINGGFEDRDNFFLEEEHLTTSLEPHQFDPRLSNAEFIRASVLDGQKIKEELFGICESPFDQQDPSQFDSSVTYAPPATPAFVQPEALYVDQPSRIKRGYDESSSTLEVQTYRRPTSCGGGIDSCLAPPVAKRRLGHNRLQLVQTSVPSSSPSNSSSDAQSPAELGSSGAAAGQPTVAAATQPTSIVISSGPNSMATVGEYDKWSTAAQSFVRRSTIRETDALQCSAANRVGLSTSESRQIYAVNSKTAVDRKLPPTRPPPAPPPPLSLVPSQQQNGDADVVHPPPPLRFQPWDAAPALTLLEVKPVSVTGCQWAVGASSGPQPVTGFRVNLYGVKAESPLDSLVSLEQSEVNRTKRLFAPIPVAMPGGGRFVRVVAQRLHFASTTLNNQRKRGDLHPDQRFFQLVLALEALTETSVAPVQRYISRFIIVRASNPGQFDSASASAVPDNPPAPTPLPQRQPPPQQRSPLPQSSMPPTVEEAATPEDAVGAWISDRPGVVYYSGNVGINTPNPAEALTVEGNLQLRGNLLQPSDARIKSIERELSPAEQLANISRIKFTATEVAGILPDAVHASSTERVPTGEPLLLVNKDRIYMENVGAVKQLGELTASLDCRIGELERMRSKLCRLRDSL
uniref:NDT80 domain-containing protein n=1 Tax=Macrostomum lignano TaxID=282301 RepID=A0A1I8IQ58_9PLAT